jgi:hypothetical protein
MLLIMFMKFVTNLSRQRNRHVYSPRGQKRSEEKMKLVKSVNFWVDAMQNQRFACKSIKKSQSCNEFGLIWYQRMSFFV